MPKETIKDLSKFLEPFPDTVQELAFWLRDFVWDLYPDCNELIYDNYNAVAFGWSVTDKIKDLICTIAVGRSTHNIQFGFYWGNEIADPEKKLIGNGKQYRYIIVKNKEDFPQSYVQKLLEESHINALSKLKERQVLKGLTIMKSISAVKKQAKK
jgi:Domain of unknown function (DU1801)